MASSSSQYGVVVVSENRPGVLYRVANVFVKRKINIEHLSVSEITRGISKFIITVNTDLRTINKIITQLHHIVEVTDAYISHSDSKIHDGVAQLTHSIEASIIKKVQLISDEIEGCISLAQGIPSFFAATHIKDSAKKAIDENLCDKYVSCYGITSLRKAIVEKVRRDNCHADVTVDHVLVTHGSIEATMAVLLTLLDKYEDVVVPTPNYASHLIQAMIASRGINPIEVPMSSSEKGWVLDMDKLEDAITPKTKAILICNPSNPLGKVYSYEELKEISRIANAHNLYIITDEMYEYFVYAGRHISIGSFPEIKDRVISIFGFSKAYAMTGWRIGYIVAHPDLIGQIFKIHDSLITCATVVSQYAALAAIEGPQDMIHEYGRAFQRRLAIVQRHISQTDKLELTPPQAGYFAFARILYPVDDYELAIDMIKKAGVAVVPGSPFGVGGQNHIRISFGGEDDILEEGMSRLMGYMNTIA